MARKDTTTVAKDGSIAVTTEEKGWLDHGLDALAAGGPTYVGAYGMGALERKFGKRTGQAARGVMALGGFIAQAATKDETIQKIGFTAMIASVAVQGYADGYEKMDDIIAKAQAEKDELEAVRAGQAASKVRDMLRGEMTTGPAGTPAEADQESEERVHEVVPIKKAN